MSDMSDIVRREIGRALNGVRGAFRSLSTNLKRDTPVQLATGVGMGEQALPDLELFQHFGFSSAPPAGTQLIVLPLGGRTSAGVVVASENGAFRFHLEASGEAALYNQWGDVVHMRADRTIHLVAEARVQIDTAEVQINATSSVTINTPEFIVDASTVVELNTPTVDASTAITAGTDITAGGDVADAGGAKTMQGMRSTYDTHTHPENDEGGPTGTPIQGM